MNGATLSRVTPKLIFGFGILTLGMLWTLDNLDILESERITEWWPVILIAIGVVRLADRMSNKAGATILIVVGIVLLLNNLDLTDWDFGDMIPLGIALIGAKIIYDALTRRERRDTRGDATEADSVVHAFAMMAGVKRQSTAMDFRGGDANAIMGGVELDLTQAKIPAGERAIVDAFAFWGGVEIKVPENWKIVGNILPIMGAFEDNTVAKGELGPVLEIRGTAIMGAIEVKN
jgi:predicted membrane protein